MTVSGKSTALAAWLSGWDGIGDYLKLNAICSSVDDRALNLVVNNRVVEEFIDGTAKREYTFALKAMAEWSSGNDDVNAEAQRVMDSWIDWVAAQYPDNLPEWDGASIEAIEPLYNVSALSNVYQDEGLAEYMFQAKITYVE